MMPLAKLIARGAVLVSGTALVAILALVSAQIGARVIAGQPLSWPDELSRILFIYLVFIGAVETSVRHTHIAVNMRDTFGLPARVDDLLDMGRMAVCILVLAIIAWGAWQMIPVVGTMSLPATGLPMSVMVLPILLGSALMILATLLNIFSRLAGRPLLPEQARDPQSEADGS